MALTAPATLVAPGIGGKLDVMAAWFVVTEVKFVAGLTGEIAGFGGKFAVAGSVGPGVAPVNAGTVAGFGPLVGKVVVPGVGKMAFVEMMPGALVIIVIFCC